jgi:hypothetical protein
MSQEPDFSDLSLQKKAEKKFGTFPYELKPTKDYLFSLYRFYLEEEKQVESFQHLKIQDIKNLGDMIGFQNYHTCQQSKKFIKDWVIRTYDWSNPTFEQELEKWLNNPVENVNSDQEIQKIYDCSIEETQINRSQVENIIQEVFNLYDELVQHPEECVDPPPHPVQFNQHRLECQVQMKKLKKSLQKSNHPLASSFDQTLYGKYLFLLERSFPVEKKNAYLNLCIIYAFYNQKQK